MIKFDHNKGIDMLKLGCTLPYLANICLHKSTDSKFYLFTQLNFDLLEKILENMVGGPTIAFTGKAVVDEIFVRKSSNFCKSIVGIDANQLYPYSVCQPMPRGLYTRWEHNSEIKSFTAREDKSRSFKNMLLSDFQQSRLDCKVESNFSTGRQKNDCFSVDGICYHCNTVIEAMGCYFHYCLCQEARPSLTDNENLKRMKEREQDQMRKEYIQQKGYKIIEMWECRIYTELMHRSKVIFEQISPINVLLAKNNSCKGLLMCDSLVMSNVILKCLNTCAATSETYHHFSEILL